MSFPVDYNKIALYCIYCYVYSNLCIFQSLSGSAIWKLRKFENSKFRKKNFGKCPWKSKFFRIAIKFSDFKLETLRKLERYAVPNISYCFTMTSTSAATPVIVIVLVAVAYRGRITIEITLSQAYTK